MWNAGEPVRAIADHVGLTEAAVYFHRKAEQWPARTKATSSTRDWATARLQWDDDVATKVIAAGLGVTVSAVYDYRDTHGWPMRNQRGRYARPAKADAAGEEPATTRHVRLAVKTGPRLLPPKPLRKRGELPPGHHVCTHCFAATTKDPCNVCGVPLRKKVA